MSFIYFGVYYIYTVDADQKYPIELSSLNQNLDSFLPQGGPVSGSLLLYWQNKQRSGLTGCGCLSFKKKRRNCVF